MAKEKNLHSIKKSVKECSGIYARKELASADELISTVVTFDKVATRFSSQSKECKNILAAKYSAAQLEFEFGPKPVFDTGDATVTVSDAETDAVNINESALLGAGPDVEDYVITKRSIDKKKVADAYKAGTLPASLTPFVSITSQREFRMRVSKKKAVVKED